MAQDATVTWLTQEAHDRLAAELAELSTHGREEIAKRIESAREEGDLKENGGYHAAKDEQGKQEARIRQLTELLRTAQVGEAPQSSGSRRTRHRDHRGHRRRRGDLPHRQP
jgi:transcription elongation factor GreA